MKPNLSQAPGPIGVFDSGYGGLTILSKIREALPQYDYIYLGDNARAPYGTRSFEIVYEFTLQAVNKLFEMINSVASQNALRVSTSVLNQVLNEAIAIVQPPTDKGKRLRLFYMTQASTKPPTFVVFVNDKDLFHFSYERYLVNQIRKEFGLVGTPVRIIVREKVEK